MSEAVGVLEGIFEQARALFLEEGVHALMFFFLIDGAVTAMGDLNGETQEQRHSIVMQMARTVREEGIDAVIIVGEAWVGPRSAGRPSFSPEAREYLSAMLAGKNEVALTLSAEILRSGSSVALGETTREAGSSFLFLAPIYEAWGQELPEPIVRN